jgi:hypothetical protein
MINRLQFDALLGEDDRAGRIALAQQCQTAAEKRFEGSYDFFDAVMAVDAQVTERLLNGTLESATDELGKAFKAAFASVPGSEKKHDSVRKQLHLMRDFYGMMADGATASEQRETLRSIARGLGLIATKLKGAFSSGGAGQPTPASTKLASPGGPAAKGRRKRAAKAVPKPSAKPKGSRSSRGVRRKGKKKSS